MTPNVGSNTSHAYKEEALRLELSTIELLVNYHAWIYSEIEPFLGDHLTEIGGGLGTFSDLLIRHHVLGQPNRTIEILEPAEHLFFQLRKKYQVPYKELLHSDRLRLTMVISALG